MYLLTVKHGSIGADEGTLSTDPLHSVRGQSVVIEVGGGEDQLAADEALPPLLRQASQVPWRLLTSLQIS